MNSLVQPSTPTKSFSSSYSMFNGRPADRQTGRPADRQTGRPADRQTGKPANLISISYPSCFASL